MTKDQFLSRLSDKLKNLNKSEVDDIISEFSMHIDTAIENGKSESDVIASFGNVDDLAKEILSTYKISSDTDFKDNLNIIINKVIETTQEVVEKGVKFTKDVFEESKKQENRYDYLLNNILKFLIAALVLVVVLNLVRYIFVPFGFLFAPFSWIIAAVVWVLTFAVNVLVIAFIAIIVIKLVENHNSTNERKDGIKTIIEKKTNPESTTEDTHFEHQETNEERKVVRKDNDLLKVFLYIAIFILLSPFILGLVGIVIGGVFAIIPLLVVMILSIITAINYDLNILYIVALGILGVIFILSSFINLFVGGLKYLFRPKNRGVK